MKPILLISKFLGLCSILLPTVLLADSPGKPVAPVELIINEPSKAINAGDTLDLNISFQVAGDVTDIKFSTGKLKQDLVSITGYSKHSLNLLANGTTEPVSLRINALRDGIEHIPLIVTTISAAGTQARAFSVPVVVGQANWQQHLKTLGKTVTSGDRRLIEVPATESISQN